MKLKWSVARSPACDIAVSMKLSSWGRCGNAHGNGRRVGGRCFHATGRLPFADESRRIAGRAAIRHDQNFVFATADGAVSRRQATIANDADGRAWRSLQTWWPGRTLRSCHACRTGVPLRARRTAGARVTLGALATIGEAEGQSSDNNKMRYPHDCAPFIRPPSCAFADCAPLPPGSELSGGNSVPCQYDSEQKAPDILGLTPIMILPRPRRRLHIASQYHTLGGVGNAAGVAAFG
jgi:hypothetical protein